jgi:hypothetical protein
MPIVCRPRLRTDGLDPYRCFACYGDTNGNSPAGSRGHAVNNSPVGSGGAHAVPANSSSSSQNDGDGDGACLLDICLLECTPALAPKGDLNAWLK